VSWKIEGKKWGEGKLLDRKGKGSLQPLPLPRRAIRELEDFQKKLKTGVNIAGTAALRQVTRDVFKFTRFLALRAV
jgi:hypothetical protein